MSTWFIFSASGEYIFQTTDESRTDLSLIPDSFDATYVIKDPPGYDPSITQQISYNTETHTVEFLVIDYDTQVQQYDNSDATTQSFDLTDLMNRVNVNEVDISNIKTGASNTQLTVDENSYLILTLNDLSNNHTSQLQDIYSQISSINSSLQTISSSISSLEELSQQNSIDIEALNNMYNSIVSIDGDNITLNPVDLTELNNKIDNFILIFDNVLDNPGFA